MPTPKAVPDLIDADELTGWCHTTTDGEMHYFPADSDDGSMRSVPLCGDAYLVPSRPFVCQIDNRANGKYHPADSAPHCASCKAIHLQLWLNAGRKK